MAGAKGFSLKPSAISRYYLTAEYRALCLKQLRSITETHSPSFVHHDLENTRILRDESDVQSLIDVMENSWINPFDSNPSDLMSMSTITAAHPDVASDLRRPREIGETAYQQFQKDRIEQQKEKFHDKLSKQKLKTFSNIKKQTRSVRSNKETILKADHKLFGQMLLISMSRTESCRKLLFGLRALEDFKESQT